MLRAVQVTNHRNEILYLELARPADTGIALTSIDGLDSVKGEMSFTELPYRDGAIFNSARAIKRNIILKMTYTGYPVEQIRHQTYQYFPLKRLVTLRFFTDLRTVYTTGRIESNEQDIFSKKAGTSISILCEGAYLLGNTETHVPFSAVTPLFEFPFENDHLTEKRIEMGSIQTTAATNFFNDGDVAVGIRIQIHAIGNPGNIEIMSVKTLGKLSINATRYTQIVGSGMTMGDVIVISTVPGQKYARATRGMLTYNILDAIDYPREWFMVDKGYNHFICSADSIWNVDFDIAFTSAYEGI